MKGAGIALSSVFKGAAREYKPLSGAAIDRILDFDDAAGHGRLGTKPNRNRLYLYLVQRGSDVEVRTVAVKAAKRGEVPVVKEVCRASVDDPWIHVRDLGYYTMAGYAVDWSPEGVGPQQYWNYAGRWEDELYAHKCSWKINAPVVNPELLKRTRRFKWSDWESSRAHILDYLKIFNEHPEVEFLSKLGLGHFSTKVSVVRKLKADRAFRRYFIQHAEKIRCQGLDVPVIIKAYGSGISFAAAKREIEARREFRFCGLPRDICAVKALEYAERRRIRRGAYSEYLKNCQMLGLDLADTKVSFPKQFERRRQAVQDQVDAIRRAENAEKVAKMNRTLAAIASEWSWLENQRGDFKLVLPRCEQDLMAEGAAMENCLKTYAPRISRGDSVVVFVRQARQPETAFVAIEYDPNRQRVSQCYGIKNSKPPKRVRDFVARVFGGLQAAVGGRNEVAA